jgi:hypothetical protein
MGIYRGPGGTGDAVNDASSQAAITVIARDEAVAANNAAQLAQAAAELAEANAQAAEAGAQAAQTAAEEAQALAEAAAVPAQSGQSGKYLKTNGVTASWDALDISTADISGTLPVANGGTGATTSAGALTNLGAYAASNPSGYTTNTGTVTSVAATVPSFLSVSGSPITTSGTLALTYSGTALPVANGGTGSITTQTAVNTLAGAVTSGSYLRGNGTNVVMSAIQAADVPTLNQNTTGTASNVTGVVAAANGGTGQSSYAVGDIVYASTTTALSKLADVATGNALISGGVGVAPSYGKVGLTTHVSGTLPIANGGTNGTATPTSGGVIVGTGTAYASTAAGTAGQILTSNGTSAPTWQAAPVSLPSQTGNTGKYLTTDGSTASWATVAAGASLSNDTSTSSNLYPIFAAATSGVPTTVYTSNAKYLYKPSTGELQASVMNATNGLHVNSLSVSASYSIPSGSSAMSVGPISVASGQSVTVPSGSRWVVL